MRHEVVVIAIFVRLPAGHFEKRNYEPAIITLVFLSDPTQLTDVKRLLSYTDEVTAHPTVNNPLLGDDVEVAVHLEDANPRGDDNGLLAGPVQVPVDEMFLEGVERDVENLQEVPLGSRGEASLGCGDSWPSVVVDDELEISPGQGQLSGVLSCSLTLLYSTKVCLRRVRVGNQSSNFSFWTTTR